MHTHMHTPPHPSIYISDANNYSCIHRILHCDKTWEDWVGTIHLGVDISGVALWSLGEGFSLCGRWDSEAPVQLVPQKLNSALYSLCQVDHSLSSTGVASSLQ